MPMASLIRLLLLALFRRYAAFAAFASNATTLDAYFFRCFFFFRFAAFH